MARPLSEEKREAILVAAAELVASLGTGAPTAKIAAAAGVAEGTLFTYFATKDDLLNELLVDIETQLAQALLASYAATKSPRERVQRVWECLVEWGKANPVQRKAMRQLKVSDRISAQTTQRCNALFGGIRGVIERSLAGHADLRSSEGALCAFCHDGAADRSLLRVDGWRGGQESREGERDTRDAAE